MMQEFKLIGLNRKTKSGIYGTVECGNEDWFHADIDETVLPVNEQYELFDKFKNGPDGIWKRSHNVVVEYDHMSSGGVPVNPIIKELKLDLQ